MRKVTASAVLLTAITGCAQSKAPTTQWSFDVPDPNETASLTNVSSDLALPLALSDDAQAFVDKAAQRLANPSFEPRPFGQPGSQLDTVNPETPNLETPAVVPLPNMPAPRGARAETERTPTATVPLADELIETYAASRPDPVAEARAYLNSNSSALISNRTPHSRSQVYLPSFPAATPISDLTPIASSPVIPSPVASSLPVSDTAPENIALQDAASQDIASNIATPALANSFVEDSFIEDSFAESSFAENSLAEDSFAENSATGDLPLLLPQPVASQADSLDAVSATAADTSVASTSTTIREMAIAQDVPLGTAILMSMQQSVADNPAEGSIEIFNETLTGTTEGSAERFVTAVPNLDPVDLTSLQRSQHEPSDISASDISASDLVAVEQPLSVNPTPTRSASVHSAPARPTLEGLIRSMPTREPSPLLADLQPLDVSSESTIYLPIADDLDQTPTRSLASSIQGVVSTLGQEAATAFTPRLELGLELELELDSAKPASADSFTGEFPGEFSSEHADEFPGELSGEPSGEFSDELSSELLHQLSSDLSGTLSGERAENSPELSESIAASMAEIPSSLGIQAHGNQRVDAATKRAIPAFKVDKSIATKIGGASRPFDLHANAVRRLKATTQRAIPAFKVDQKISSAYRNRAFWQ